MTKIFIHRTRPATFSPFLNKGGAWEPLVSCHFWTSGQIQLVVLMLPPSNATQTAFSASLKLKGIVCSILCIVNGRNGAVFIEPGRYQIGVSFT